MVSLQRAYYYCHIVFVVLLGGLLFTSCAGRGTGGGVSSVPASRTPSVHVSPAPKLKDPVIRIGLKTDAKTVSFTSEDLIYFSDGANQGGTPNRVTAGLSYVAKVSTQYSVQVESFSAKKNADDSAKILRSKTRHPIFVFFNPDRNFYQVRVGPFGSKDQAQQAVEEMKSLGYPGAFYVSDDRSSETNRAQLVLTDDGGNVILRTNRTVQIWNNALLLGIDTDRFRGTVSVFVNSIGRLTVVNNLNFEDYLKGVVPNEIGGGSVATHEAIKAQAVAARTYAYKNLHQFENDGYDLCATPRCQVYSGISTESSQSTSAVEETAGEILTYNAEPINALYTSTCGGRTENAEYMFEGWDYPYLKSVECYPEENGTTKKAVELAGVSQPWWYAWLRLKTDLQFTGDWNNPVTTSEVATATTSILEFLGKRSCGQSPPLANHWIAVGQYLVDQLCWQSKRDSLLNEKDYRYFLEHLSFSLESTPETHSFLFLFHDQILLPRESELPKFNPYQALTRMDFYQGLFRILDHYHQINASRGTIREISRNEVQIIDDTGVHLYVLNSDLALFQKIGDSLIPKDRLVCSPGDQIEYVIDNGTPRLLVCELNQAGATVDRSSKYTFWRESATPAELGEKVSKYADVGEITDLEPLSYGASHRIYELKITGTKGNAVLRGLRVRWALGLRDNLFVIDKTYDSSGRIRNFTFTGRGWGHGVGMCQVGALGYAKLGKDYREILKHYYLGVEITRKY
jgi:peptidoglycan hydrolase-like amidase